MIESMDIAEGLRKLTVGRITYCMFTAIPVTVFLHLVFEPGHTRDEAFRDFMLFWLMIFLDVPIVLVGAGILLHQRLQGQPLRFWSLVGFVAAFPILYFIVGVILSTLGVHIPPFTGAVVL